jgi:putative hydrolase of HD superfamily
MDLPKFFEITMRMKEVERTGWTERGVKNPETSSDHSLMTALMVLVLGKRRKLNLDKAMKMALIHDLPEAIVGDIISKENWEKGGQMWKREKLAKEGPAVKKLASLSGCSEILELWKEFESRKTPEARFVKDIDRVATILQAMEYQRKGNYQQSVKGFWDENALSSIKDPELRKFVEDAVRKLEKK